MYIGLGTIVLIVIIVLVVLMLRRGLHPWRRILLYARLAGSTWPGAYDG
jgi:hypothetical protein